MTLNKTILLVDDVVDLVELLTLEIQAWGYDVVGAYDGLQCLEKVKQEKPDLILLDIMMPKMNGIEACKKLKSSDASKKIPIIFVTGRDDAETKKNALKAGGNEFLTKGEIYTELKPLLEKYLVTGTA